MSLKSCNKLHSEKNWRGKTARALLHQQKLILKMSCLSGSHWDPWTKELEMERIIPRRKQKRFGGGQLGWSKSTTTLAHHLSPWKSTSWFDIRKICGFLQFCCFHNSVCGNWLIRLEFCRHKIQIIFCSRGQGGGKVNTAEYRCQERYEEGSRACRPAGLRQ